MVNNMDTVRINISLPRDIVNELSQEIGPRERSRFIREAVRLLLKKRKEKRLAAEYREAAEDIQRINLELEGTVDDGLD